MVALRPLSAGFEVFNTYGEHANRTLLCDYGFTLQLNPLDCAELPWSVVVSAVAATVPGGSRWMRTRERTLRASACAACLCELVDDDDDGAAASFTFDLGGSPPGELLLVLWLLLAKPEAQPRWMADCSSDEAAELETEAVAAARELVASSLEQQLSPPTPLLVDMRSVLIAALSGHAASLSSCLAKLDRPTLRASVRPADIAAAARAAHAATVIEGELRILKRALERLGGGCVRAGSKRGRASG